MMMVKAKIIFCLLLVCVSYVENARILAIFPLPSPSHFMMYRVLLKALAEKGHEVDVLSPFPLKTPLKGYNELTVAGNDAFRNNITLEMGQHFNDARVIVKVCGVDLCEQIFATEIARKIRDSRKKYDLLITELFASDCFLGFGHVLNIPTIVATSSVSLPWGSDRFGNPDNPAYIPNYFAHYTSDMTLQQRIINTAQYVYMKIIYYWHSTVPSNRVAKEFFGADLPDLNELAQNTSLLLVNSHFSLNCARPVPPNFVEVGGLHVQPPKKLSQYFTNLLKLEDGVLGVIYLSMGSMLMTESLPNAKLQPIFDSMRELPYKVLWKANASNFNKDLSIPENVHFEGWLPQMEILCDANVKVFISHGGLMGSQEAVYCGVPRLGIPIFADQELNINAAEATGTAVKVAYEDISKDAITNALRKLIDNPSYLMRAKEMSIAFKDRPMSALDTAIYWVEYVIRHKGGPLLRSKASQLYLYQYLLIDVICVYATGLYLIYAILIRFYRFIFKRNQHSSQKKHN